MDSKLVERFINDVLKDTLINEEAYLLAKFLRNEKSSWKPRVANL